ncbi:MAG: 30S ribosomal protein S20 [Planctomycetia bacterium]|nr:30S ribosomal protein S20 [Planctomycetia bacterium]
MPNIKSAKKRLRQSEEKKVTNLAVKRELRGDCRKVREAVAAGDAAKATEEFQTATKHMDRAASKRIVHPNTVARTKSRLSAAIKAVKTAKAE